VISRGPSRRLMDDGPAPYLLALDRQTGESLHKLRKSRIWTVGRFRGCEDGDLVKPTGPNFGHHPKHIEKDCAF